MSTIRVALTVGPTGYGGTATYSRELLSALSRRDDVEVVAVGSAEAVAELTGEPRSVVLVPTRRTAEQVGVAISARRLHAAGVDVVHATRQVVPVGLRRPAVLTFHDDFALSRSGDYDWLKRAVLPPLFRRSLRRADAVITLDERMVNLARRYVAASTPVIDAGAAVAQSLTSAVPAAPRTPLPPRFALTVGDANPRKGVAELLDSWPTIAEESDLPLVIAGARVADEGLRRRIEATPSVVLVRQPDWSELAHLYRCATLVVDGSFDEGFGFARAEAAWAGARFVAVRDHASAAQAVTAALAEPTREPSMSSWDDVADRTVEVYRRAIADRAR